MASISFIVGIIGNVIAILMFASPIPTFWEVVKKKSTEEYEGIPYVTTLLCTSIWTLYGILKPDGLVIVTTSGAGSFLQLLYVTLFLIYAPKHKRIKMAKLVGLLDVGLFGVVVAVTLLAIHGNLRLRVAGIFGVVLATAMYASPLSVMRTVIQTKSVEYMPFLLSFFFFVNGGVWTVYALLVRDIYLLVPSSIGFILGSVQLIIYATYKIKSKSKVSMDLMKQIEENEGNVDIVVTNVRDDNVQSKEQKKKSREEMQMALQNHKVIDYITTTV